MPNVKELNINSTTYDIIGKGVVDQNNPSTPLKQWSGTKAQYDAIVSKDANTIYNITDDANVGSFANTDLSNLSPTGESVLAGKVDLATGVTQADVDYVVESQLPTSGNNYTWYRLYKSGWVEQGSRELKSATGNNSAWAVSYTLPIEMADNNYTATANGSFAGGSSWNGPYISTESTSTTVTFTGWVTGSSTAKVVSWVVSGMSAQGG